MERKYTRWDSLDTRFWGLVDKTGECWLWTGPLTKKGYGRNVGYQGKMWSPHRLAYILLVGDIPEGMTLDHLCRVKTCVNPGHLEPVTSLENTTRAAAARAVESCPNGHPAELKKRLPSGKRICLQCRRDSDKKRHTKNGDARRHAARARHARKKEAA